MGLPLAGLRAFLWTNTAKRAFPLLTAVKEAELRNLRPFLSDLNPVQVRTQVSGQAHIYVANMISPAIYCLRNNCRKLLDPSQEAAIAILQVAAVAAADVVPAVLLLLPAAQGGLTLSFGVYASMLHSRIAGIWDFTPSAYSEVLPAVLAILMTATLCSLAHYAETATSGAVHAS